MRSNAAAASMQKTYDECYLICSTAVYYEKQNNEEEALKSWRSALDQIYYHNAYRVPANYKVKSETEKALQDSLHDMEMQCKERVDLLGALRKSRLEASRPQESSSTPPTLPRRSQVSSTQFSSQGQRNGGLGEGTVAAVNYPDLARPNFLNRPTIQKPPQPTRESSSATSIQSLSSSLTPPMVGIVSRTSSSQTLPVPEALSQSRSPSPEKKPGMLRTTLRPPNKEVKTAPGKFSTSGLRGKQKPAAATAATVAWPSSLQTGSEANISTQAPSQPHLNNSGLDSPTRLSDVSQSQATSGRKTPQPSKITPQTYKAARASRPALPLSQPSSQSALASESNGAFLTASKHAQLPGTKTSNSTQLLGSTVPVRKSAKSTPPPVPPHRMSNPFEEHLPPLQPTVSTGASSHHKDESTQDLSLSQKTSQNSQQANLGPLPQAEFPSYRKEYPKPEPMDPRKVDSIMASRNVPVETYKGTQAATGAQIRAQQPKITRQKSPAHKQAPPIPRKAVAGTPPSSSAGPTYPGLADNRLSQYQEGGDHVLVELPGVDVDSEDAAAAAWDARVKHLMKNLPRGVDEQAAKAIFNEIVIKGDEVHWDDVAGLDIAKTALKEAVVYPFLRPDLFMGLREPARGMLLFGPPGTGKTMLARAVATESKSTFFAISASSLTSKFLGESEKLVRALFALAKVLAPSIIFVDEIDSLLSSRSGSGEHEATRRIKTEFLIQWSDLQKAAAGRDPSGEKEGDASRVLVLAATNLPWAIDEAARRRFVRRQYIPLPEPEVREAQMRRLMSAQKHSLRNEELEGLVELTDGFSGSDITALAKDAAMGPLRSLGERLLSMSPDEIRPVGFIDFEASLVNIRPSVSKQGLQEYEDWAKEFGERGG